MVYFSATSVFFAAEIIISAEEIVGKAEMIVSALEKFISVVEMIVYTTDIVASDDGVAMKTKDDAEIAVPYNHDLKPLEDVLAVVQRPGDFLVRGLLATQRPRVA